MNAPPEERRSLKTIALAVAIGLSILAVAAVYVTGKLSRDDCVKVTTDLGAGVSRSVETCT